MNEKLEYSSIPVEDQTPLEATITSSIDHLKDDDGFIDYKIDSNDWAVIKKIYGETGFKYIAYTVTINIIIA